MNNILLQTGFGGFSQGPLLFIVLIVFAFIYASVQLRSPVTMAATTFLGITIAGVMVLDLPITFFWFMLVLALISLTVSMFVFIDYS